MNGELCYMAHKHGNGNVDARGRIGLFSAEI
jgi:hypothetical protein